MPPRPKGRVTITSLANHLGLSVATVSYVMNGKTAENGIPEKTAQRVREAARKFDYVPNDLARSLRKQQTSTVGLILSDLQQGWADRTVRGMISVLEPAGYVLYLAVHFWDAERERRELDSMVKRRIETIVTVPMAENAAAYNEVVGRGVPLLFLQDEIEKCPGASVCMWEASNATRACVEHLYSIGRRRIAFSGVDQATPWLKMRLDAYKQSLKALGLPLRPEWICLDRREAILPASPDAKPHWGEAVEALLRSGGELPDAFLAMNDAVAMTTLDVLTHRCGYRVPEDFALMGMGDLALGPLVGLSSAREPVEEVGRAAARTALELIKRKGTERIRNLVSSDEIVVRASTQPPPVVVADSPAVPPSRRRRGR